MKKAACVVVVLCLAYVALPLIGEALSAWASAREEEKNAEATKAHAESTIAEVSAGTEASRLKAVEARAALNQAESVLLAARNRLATARAEASATVVFLDAESTKALHERAERTLLAEVATANEARGVAMDAVATADRYVEEGETVIRAALAGIASANREVAEAANAAHSASKAAALAVAALAAAIAVAIHLNRTTPSA